MTKVFECTCLRGHASRVSAICIRSPWKGRGTGSTDVPLSELDMKHRKWPLWSLPTCQSALHRDCLLRLLMRCTDRPETHSQTQTYRKKRRHSYELDWCQHSNSSQRGCNNDDQWCGQSTGLIFYIWIPISLSDCEACWGSAYEYVPTIDCIIGNWVI